MSSFRGNGGGQPGPIVGPQNQNSPALYNPQLAHPHNHLHSQHSPAIQNDTLVGKAIQTVRIFINYFFDVVHLFCLLISLVDYVIENLTKLIPTRFFVDVLNNRSE